MKDKTQLELPFDDELDTLKISADSDTSISLDDVIANIPSLDLSSWNMNSSMMGTYNPNSISIHSIPVIGGGGSGGGTGTIVTSSNTNSSSYSWNQPWSWNTMTDTIGIHNNINNTLQVNGDAEFDGDVKIKGRSIIKTLDEIADRLAILNPAPELEEKWEKLRDLKRQYDDLLADIRKKEEIYDILKRQLSENA